MIRTDGGARGNPGPAGIGVVIEEVVVHCLDDPARYLGAPRAVKIGYRMAVVNSFKSGKLLANFCDG